MRISDLSADVFSSDLALPAKVELAHSRAIGGPDRAGDIRIEPFARFGSENLVLGRIVKIHSASSRPDPCASAQSFLTQVRPGNYAKFDRRADRKSTRLNSSH